MSYMRLKSGFNVCIRCAGKGCHRCRLKGYIILCPICGQAEPEFTEKDGDDYRCLNCEAKFSKAGEVLQ